MSLQDTFVAWAGGAEMDGRTFAKMCKEVKLLDKRYTATDCDLLFTKVKQTAGVKGKSLGFQHFQACLEGISSKKGVGLDEVADAICRSGGPSFAGATRPDAVRFHDDKSTYTGIYLNGGPSTTGDGPMELHQLLDRSPADVRGVKYDSLRKSTSNAQLLRSNSKRSNGSNGSAKHLLPDEFREKDEPSQKLPPAVSPNSGNNAQRTTSSRNLIMQVLPRGNSGKLPPAGPPRSQSSKKLLVATQSAMRLARAGSRKDVMTKPGTGSFRRFDSFGGPKRDELVSNEPPSPELQEIFRNSAGKEGMDGRTFGKIMADAKVGGMKNIATDADLAFAYVKTQGKNKITEVQFEAAVRHLASRLGLDFVAAKDKIVGAGGPHYSGTKADAVRFHDDKSTYTGIYLNGGPSTSGDGPMELSNLLDRSPADVRGVKVHSDAHEPMLKPSTGSYRRLDSMGGPKRDELVSNEPPSPELREIFRNSAGKEGMDGRTFGKIMSDAKVGGKKNISTDADLAFAYVKTQGKNKISEVQFEAAVRHLAGKLGLDFVAVKDLIVGAGGPRYSGTKADAVRFHDDKSTYTGMHVNGGPTTTGDGPMELSNLLDRSPADVRGVKIHSDALEPMLKPSTESHRRLDSMGGPKRDELVSNEPPSPELREIFRNSAGKEGMDGRTFVKIMTDAKVGGKKNISTDADLAFAHVKTQGANRISEVQFEAAVRHLAGRLGLDFVGAKDLIVEAGGPLYSGTKADAVRFHDDKSTYTGVYLNGGPSTTGDGAMELSNLLDRSPADVRGVKING